MSSSDAGHDRLPLKVCLGFGVGTIGVSIMLNAVTAYFPAYMSTVLGKSTELAGYLLMASKLYDAFADIVIGMMSDRTRSRWGRRRPFLLAGGLVSALSFLMIFTAPEMGDTALMIYMLLALIIYSTGYSLFNVPYMAMPSEMTASPYERSRLLSFRTIFVSLGQILAMAGTAALISRSGGGAEGYMVMGWVIALVIGTTMILSFFGTARAPVVGVDPAHVAPLQGGDWKTVLKNRPFCLLMAAKVCQFLAFASLATTSLLFMLNVLNLGYAGQVQLALAQNIACGLSMPGWLWMERRMGKRNAYLIGIALMSLAALSWLLVGPGGVSVTGLILRGIGAGIGAGGMILLSISMLADALAHDRHLTGLRREGLLSSIMAVIEKAAFAIGVALVGILLNMAQYVPTRNGALVQQPDSAITALYAGYVLIPTLLFLCNAGFIWFYTLGGRSPAFAKPAGVAP
ncbi:MFS transporter [Niveispirillum irakense]|uniref:MFS transporter n=1 Tax=Niveispirillum irakense TaxID=34011 RepID=UPI0003F5E487|nr:MFS transporter [Niveispirillum irakense]